MENDVFFTHPGQVIGELLQKNHMTQLELSQRTGISVKHLNELIHQKKSLTASTAGKIANVFDVSQSFLLQLQCLFDLEKDELKTIVRMTEEEKDLAQTLPYDALHHWGYAPKSHLTREERVLYFRKFIGVSDLSRVPVFLHDILAERQDVPVYELAIWLKMGQWEANRIETGWMNVTGLKKHLATLNQLMKMSLDEAIIPLSSFLAQYGIALCFIPPLEGLEAEGFVQYREDDVILAITEHFHYEDEFWLMLYQLIGVFMTQRSKNLFIAFPGSIPAPAEAWAKKMLIHPGHYRQLLQHLDLEHILNTARDENILIGQLVGLLIDDGYLDPLDYEDFRRKRADKA